jgi:hypothetical protein
MTINDEEFRRAMAFVHAELVVQRIAIHHIMEQLSKADLLDFEKIITKIKNINVALDKSGPILSESRLFKDIMAQAPNDHSIPAKWRPVVVGGAEFQDRQDSESYIQNGRQPPSDEPSQ